MTVMRNAGKPDEEKSRAVKKLERHQENVKKERANYQKVCLDIAAALPPSLDLGRHPPCSFRGRNHISFDFAQQMHYPSDPLQPGPIYFKTPRKCGLGELRASSETDQLFDRRS